MASPGLPYIFSNKAGAALEKAAQLTSYWERLLKRLGSPGVVPPHRCAALSQSHPVIALTHIDLSVKQHVQQEALCWWAG